MVNKDYRKAERIHSRFDRYNEMMMPKMNNFEMVRKLRQDEKTSHIPIISLTANI
ncbi:MAG: hypothetical protein U5J96_04065 [Ignavibacteriaceae bacterium]|nr:hypothetical protein [Ignavibacteriaceae bacterium]